MNANNEVGYTLLEGDAAAAKGRYAVVVSRWNSFVVEKLKQGAIDTLTKNGIEESEITVCYAPGAYEFPLVTKKLAGSGNYDGIIVVGAVIRGETPHFDFVAGECSRGLAQVALESGIPIGFGVLTVDNVQQAEDRAGPKVGNKGEEAAQTALEMVSLLRQI